MKEKLREKIRDVIDASGVDKKAGRRIMRVVTAAHREEIMEQASTYFKWRRETLEEAKNLTAKLEGGLREVSFNEHGIFIHLEKPSEIVSAGQQIEKKLSGRRITFPEAGGIRVELSFRK